MSSSITGVGGYLPLLRMDRAAAARALKSSGLGGGRGGRRAVAGWDEDAVTLAAEAARAIAGPVDRLVFASTSAPFYERAHSTLLAHALSLPPGVRTADLAGSRRCAVSGLLDALLGSGETIVAAGECRRARPGSAAHLGFGDGGAAARVGSGGGARLIGHASLARDFVDVYASRDHPTPYPYEERFVRDTAGRTIVAPTILAACRNAGIDPAAIAHAAVHEPLPGMWRDIAGETGIGAANHAATLDAVAGDLGAAHPLYAMALAFAAARAGDIVLVAGFGSGCDALLFEMTGPVAGSDAVVAGLGHGIVTQDYVRFLSLTGGIDLDWGVRAEVEQKGQGTVLDRYGADMLGFVGGRDAAGNVQFPKSPLPVRPGATGAEAMADVPLADVPARLLSVTADRLIFTPDPPFCFGLVQFDNGARVLMELTDAGPDGFHVGDPLAMRLRIKTLDRRRGFRSYFWKAAPVERPVLED